MQRLKPDVDIVLDILKAVVEAQPHSTFAASLLNQYLERGGLSKKQLEGLYGKASKLEGISTGKLATLEAIILKKHEKHRSSLPAITPLYEKDSQSEEMILAILSKFPAHKRVLFFKSKLDNNEPFSPAEKTELNKFFRLLR